MKKCLLTFLIAFAAVSGFTQHLRIVPERVVDSLQRKKEFQYANDPEYWTVKKPSTGPGFWEGLFNVMNSTIFRWFVFLFFIALFLFIIYRVLKVQGVFDRKNKKVTVSEEAHELEDISLDTLEAKIQDFYQSGDLRQAVRYHYLHLLKLLALKDMLKLNATATNHDYVLQMSKSSMYADFSLLTNVYDHVWYGEIAPDAMQYSRIDAYFRKMKIGLS